jgi:hypothetical protein
LEKVRASRIFFITFMVCSLMVVVALKYAYCVPCI